MSLTADAPYHGFRHPAIGGDGWQKWFEPSWIYVIASGRDERPVKIGYAGCVEQRILAFEAGNPLGLRALHRFATCKGMARQVERRVHELFKDRALGREWFDVHADEAAAAIPGLCELGRQAVEAYRDSMLADDTKIAAAEGSVARAHQIQAAMNRARAMVALQRARERRA